LLDRWLGMPHIGLILGLVVGTALAIYLIVKRLGA
jgi:ATP synthase protein I